MRSLWRLVIFLVCVSTVAMPAEPHNSSSHNQTTTAGPAWSEFAAEMGKMHTNIASVTPSGDSDTDFVALMLPHHQAAIDMARTQLMYGKDPQMRRLAQEIVTDQQSEIDLMQLWLKQHAAHSPRVDQSPVLHANKEH